MLTKILFTLAVIALVFGMMRFRRQRGIEMRQRPQPLPVPTRAPFPIGWLATGVVVLMLLVGGVLLYDHWRDNNQVIHVRVVDAGSGHSVNYRAYRGDIEDREFVTVDGVHVVLAETERLETFSTPHRD
jgi:protein-S-isoprenylcysteine O-methyltransferase Ste14